MVLIPSILSLRMVSLECVVPKILLSPWMITFCCALTGSELRSGHVKHDWCSAGGRERFILSPKEGMATACIHGMPVVWADSQKRSTPDYHNVNQKKQPTPLADLNVFQTNLLQPNASHGEKLHWPSQQNLYCRLEKR